MGSAKFGDANNTLYLAFHTLIFFTQRFMRLLWFYMALALVSVHLPLVHIKYTLVSHPTYIFSKRVSFPSQFASKLDG